MNNQIFLFFAVVTPSLILSIFFVRLLINIMKEQRANEKER
jgi:hypothetical protein